MIDILVRWNRWGTAKLLGGIVRSITSTITEFVTTNDIIVLMGPRRAGKSTILYQVMDYLEKTGVEQKAMLHINFEEPAFAPRLSLQLLDDLYGAYRTEVFPSGKAYLFLDEIQNISEWERWVRSRNQTEDIKIFITGSSSKLMSRELATVLTGRHLSFQVYPLSFREFLQFNAIIIPPKPWSFQAPALIQHALIRYMKWGGYPEVVLSDSEKRKELLITQYFDDMLFKDIALRHSIRDVMSLRSLAVHLVGQTAQLITFKRLATLFSISTDTASSYCTYLHESFFSSFVPYFSFKVAERNRNPKKVHAVDLGLRSMVTISGSPDKGKLVETLVHNHVLQTTKDALYYWKDNGEIDLLTYRDSVINKVIQVMYEGLDNEKVMQRGIGALKEAKEHFPQAQALLIVGDIAGKLILPKNEGIECVPLWHFLLSDFS
ncbi:ATP-binding protein [Candidatus Dependentiae bacterium]|nr:ATP-binding protein [Candidatus Dependentiae bacterium]